MTERKLASAQRIVAIEPHGNADALEIARILGWECVVKKGEFKAGDLVTYFEVDSLLPVKPEYEFLRKSCYRTGTDAHPEGFRIKTIRLRGRISQGLCWQLPVGVFAEGQDLTEQLGVTHYEAHEPEHRTQCSRKPMTWWRKLWLRLKCLVTGRGYAALAKSEWPVWIPKTDETRIQAMPHVLTLNQDGAHWYAAEKLDGSSMTVAWYKGKGYVCSRNVSLTLGDGSHFCTTAQALGLPAGLASHVAKGEDGIILQGELIGPGIQGNKYKLTEFRFHPFNLVRVKGLVARRAHREELESVCGWLSLVPCRLIEVGPLPASVDAIVKHAVRDSHYHPTPAEGIVWRPLTGDLQRSFKVINPEFLLKWDL